jgi:hypothetical protein
MLTPSHLVVRVYCSGTNDSSSQTKWTQRQCSEERLAALSGPIDFRSDDLVRPPTPVANSLNKSPVNGLIVPFFMTAKRQPYQGRLALLLSFNDVSVLRENPVFHFVSTWLLDPYTMDKVRKYSTNTRPRGTNRDYLPKR